MSETSELAYRQARRFLGELSVSLREQSGGLSGARVWRIESSRGTFALRQYPTEFPTEERLRWFHRYLKEVQDRGCSQLPCPVAIRDGATWIEHESHYWELLTWIHGEPRLETAPSRELLIAAAAALARLHRHSEQLPCAPRDRAGQTPPGLAPGLAQRRELALAWQLRDRALIEQKMKEKTYPPNLRRLFPLQKTAFAQHFAALERVFQQAAQVQDRLLPVLRDVQPAHVLFAGTDVAGFIDVSAARIDSALGDLARLLQRWRYAEPDWYADAVTAYHEVRPLPANERVILDTYDFSARLLTGVQWLRWLVLEEREFANQALVEQHLQRAEQALGELIKGQS